MKTALLPAVAAVILSGCTKGPELRTTPFNLGFEYTLCDTLPAQWVLPDVPFHGYAASAVDENPLQGTRCLRKALGDACRSFGFTFYEGTYTGVRPDSPEFTQQAQRAFPGTVEYLLGQLGEERFILDLKRMRAAAPDLAAALDRLRFRHVGALKTANEFQDTQISEAFDYLVFIRTSTPSQLGFR